MTALSSNGQFGTLVDHDSADHMHQPSIFVQAEEPKATEPVQKSRSETIPSTQRARASRVRYSLEFKRRVLRLVDACTERGQIGEVLRREGIYYSTLKLFLKQRETGRLDAAGSARTSKKAEAEALAKQFAQLQRQNLRLAAKLEKAEIVIDFQKKLSRLLELGNQESSENS